MPRFLFETAPISRGRFESLTRFGDQRFPEVAVERCYAPHAEGPNREVWVCRAPSEAHLRRWAEATCLAPLGLRHVDAYVAHRLSESEFKGASMSTIPTTAPARHLNKPILNVLIVACLLAAVVAVAALVGNAVQDDNTATTKSDVLSSAGATARYTTADAAERAAVASAATANAVNAARFGSADAAERSTAVSEQSLRSGSVADAIDYGTAEALHSAGSVTVSTPPTIDYTSADAAEHYAGAGRSDFGSADSLERRNLSDS
jgi:hypothetical protein